MTWKNTPLQRHMRKYPLESRDMKIRLK